MQPREFAIYVVDKLQRAGFEALWAGGCVRDRLMGLEPKDYDVATSARPEQVRDVFGHRRTLAIGESFGVIAVLGGKASGQIEVATFRREADYSDGRRPSSVEFTDAKEDARRRDFTINGLFYDPIRDEVLDFVGGRRDLEEHRVRAIGDPHERISEDKLRMLRGVRFAATLGYELERGTREAIISHAAEIDCISGERIGAEMRRMLVHPARHIACQLLVECDLMQHILPQGELLYANPANWNTRLKWLERLGFKGRWVESQPGNKKKVEESRGDVAFETSAAVLLAPILKESAIEPVANRWRLSVAERRSIQWLDQHWLQIGRSKQLPWSQMQPFLIHRDAAKALQIARAALGDHHPGVQFCLQRLAWPQQELDPPPLISGDDLQALGMTPGKEFAKIIAMVRAMQLDGELNTKQAALEFVQQKYGAT